MQCLPDQIDSSNEILFYNSILRTAMVIIKNDVSYLFSTLTFAKCGLMLRKMLTSTLDVIKLQEKRTS